MVNDTVKLLKECDCGTKTAIIGIVEVREKVSKQEFKEELSRWIDKYNVVGEKMRNYLEEMCDSCGKSPSKMAVTMVKGVTKLRSMDADDAKLADMLIKSGRAAEKKLNKYIEDFCEANEDSEAMARELIALQDEFCTVVEKYKDKSCD